MTSMVTAQETGAATSGATAGETVTARKECPSCHLEGRSTMPRRGFFRAKTACIATRWGQACCRSCRQFDRATCGERWRE